MTTLGREIKKARAALGWQQKMLREQTGISQKYLSRIENDHVDPSWSYVVKITHALHMDLRPLCMPIPSGKKEHDDAAPEATISSAVEGAE